CEKGILVNDHMQTNDPAIFAVGECAQVGEHLAGTTAEADAQARALAEYFRGNDNAPYTPAPTANILKLRGMQPPAAGITDPDPAQNFETVLFHDAGRRLYQKCVIQDDRLVGTICLGDTARFQEFLRHMTTGIELEDLRDTLLRPGDSAARAPL